MLPHFDTQGRWKTTDNLCRFNLGFLSRSRRSLSISISIRVRSRSGPNQFANQGEESAPSLANSTFEMGIPGPVISNGPVWEPNQRSRLQKPRPETPSTTISRNILPTIPSFLRRAGNVLGRFEDLGASFLHPLSFTELFFVFFLMGDIRFAEG